MPLICVLSICRHFSRRFTNHRGGTGGRKMQESCWMRSPEFTPRCWNMAGMISHTVNIVCVCVCMLNHSPENDPFLVVPAMSSAYLLLLPWIMTVQKISWFRLFFYKKLCVCIHTNIKWSLKQSSPLICSLVLSTHMKCHYLSVMSFSHPSISIFTLECQISCCKYCMNVWSFSSSTSVFCGFQCQ